MTSQQPEMIARIKSAYDRLVAERVSEDGLLDLPAEAVLASGKRP